MEIKISAYCFCFSLEFSLFTTVILSDLYNELTMPPELRKAHQQNDFAVMSAYGFDRKITESECVAELMKLYQKFIKEGK